NLSNKPIKKDSKFALESFLNVQTIHRSGITKFYAREGSTAQEMRNPTRGRGPPLGNREILRAGVVHRSGNAKSHAQERSTTQKLQNPTRSSSSPHTSSD